MLKKHIPNTITCLNLISGCIATYYAFQADYSMALLFIVVIHRNRCCVRFLRRHERTITARLIAYR